MGVNEEARRLAEESLPSVYLWTLEQTGRIVVGYVAPGERWTRVQVSLDLCYRKDAGARIERVEREREEARASLEVMRRHIDGEQERRLMSRNIFPEQGDVVCVGCYGSGVKLYSSTARWGGGVGGQVITADVCDKCWGSGKSNEPWPSHRRIAELERERDEARTILAHTDIGSLPNDWTLKQVAEARIDDLMKLRDQVRDTCARAEKAERRIAELERERDEARANYAFMVDRAAQREPTLDGYRELGAKCAQLEQRLDEARAENARLLDSFRGDPPTPSQWENICKMAQLLRDRRRLIDAARKQP